MTEPVVAFIVNRSLSAQVGKEQELFSKMMRLPSGDQFGSPPIMLLGVSCLSPDPSIDIVQTAFAPLRLLVKARLVPSGETLGCESAPVLVVSCRRLVPSASMVNRSYRHRSVLRQVAGLGSFRLESNMILDPSGVQVG